MLVTSTNINPAYISHVKQLVRYRTKVRPKKASVPFTQQIKQDLWARKGKVVENKVPSGQAKEEIQKIIQAAKGNRESTFKDLENQRLDLDQPNLAIVDYIIKSQTHRFEQRLDKTSEKWLIKFNSLVGDVQNDHKHKKDHKNKVDLDKRTDALGWFKKEIATAFSNATICAAKVGEPITIGDLVLLREGTTSFYMVVSCPKSLDSAYYTLVNREGKIVFAAKPQIRFRVPTFIPQHLHNLLESMVMMEEKTLDVAPIGVLDRNGTKSEASMPISLRKSPQKDLDPQIVASAAAEAAEEFKLEEDDFMSSKLSSTMLTNTDTMTYILPPVAREIFSQPLTQISIESMGHFKNLSTKLENLHRTLQYDHNHDILGSPRMVSIFELLHRIKKGGVPVAVSTEEKGSKLGQPVYTDSKVADIERGHYDVSLYVGVLLVLRRQARLWWINESGSTNPVTSVLVLPIEDRQERDDLCKTLSQRHNEVSDYIVRRLKQEENGREQEQKGEQVGEPGPYKSVIQLFKSFVAGNIDADSELQVWCATILRDICKEVKTTGNFKYDYGKARCYEVLEMLGEVELDDPSKWSKGMGLESFSRRLEKRYYEYLEKAGETKAIEEGEIRAKEEGGSRAKEEAGTTANEKVFVDDFFSDDPVKEIRQDYTEPIFCIDSETAHEIDDGISIKEQDNNYLISIHIANPSSYIKPDSVLSQIALEYGFTTYLPDGPLKMFPDVVSDISGLGINRKTRTFAIEYQISKEFEQMSLEQIQNQMRDTSCVKFYNAYSFPKGYTYKQVDRILDGEVDEHRDKLQVLFDISKKLNQIRVEIGNARSFELGRSSVSVKIGETYGETDGETNRTDERVDEDVSTFSVDKYGYKLKTKGVEIFIENINSQSQSTQLVTEMMISANYLTSDLAVKNKVPIIFRNQKINLPEAITKEINQMDAKNVESMKKAVSVMNAAKVDLINKGHESLGLSSYGHITSPLRRYSDMINQWAFQNHFTGSGNQFDVSNIVNHLQAREVITKNLSLKSTLFWQGIFLKEYFRILDTIPKENHIQFQLTVDKKAGNNVVMVTLSNFQVKSVIEVEEPEQLRQITNQNITIEQLELQQGDFIENEFVFKCK